MANKSVFASKTGRRVPPATSANRAGAPAYAYDDAHVLAQVAMTGSFGALTYTDPMEELEYVLMLAETVEPEFLAKTAVYARTVVRRKPERGGDYNVVLVDLDEGVRMMSRVDGIAHDEIAAGLKVSASIGEGADGGPAVVFRPEGGAS